MTSALLLGGAVLLTAYVNAPAAVTPAPARVSSADLATIDALAPVAVELAEQAERLRARLATAPTKSVSTRDPFHFGERSDSTPSPDVAEPQSRLHADIDTAVTAPIIMWPTLVALLTDRDDPEVRTTVLATDDGVEVLKVGDTMGGFVVREITATAVELVHVATSTTTRLVLR